MCPTLLVSLLLTLGPLKPGVPRAVVIDRKEQPVFVVADGKGGARILLDETNTQGFKDASLSELVMLPGAKVPEHVHETSAEMIYILEGHGTMTVDGRTQTVQAGMAIFIPAGVKHGLVVDTKVEPMRALQVYSAAGPEQRFRAGESTKE